MNITKEGFLDNFKTVFEEFDVSLISMETKFREIEEWSSLSSLSLIAVISEEYGINISGEEIRKSEKVEDIYKIICK